MLVGQLAIWWQYWTPCLLYHSSSERQREMHDMTLTLVFRQIPWRVLQHVGLVRSELCGVLAQWPISIFSSFFLSLCQKTTVITQEQQTFPPRPPKSPGLPSDAHRGTLAPGLPSDARGSTLVPNSLSDACGSTLAPGLPTDTH